MNDRGWPRSRIGAHVRTADCDQRSRIAPRNFFASEVLDHRKAHPCYRLSTEKGSLLSTDTCTDPRAEGVMKPGGHGKDVCKVSVPILTSEASMHRLVIQVSVVNLTRSGVC